MASQQQQEQQPTTPTNAALLNQSNLLDPNNGASSRYDQVLAKLDEKIETNTREALKYLFLSVGVPSAFWLARGRFHLQRMFPSVVRGVITQSPTCEKLQFGDAKKTFPLFWLATFQTRIRRQKVDFKDTRKDIFGVPANLPMYRLKNLGYEFTWGGKKYLGHTYRKSYHSQIFFDEAAAQRAIRIYSVGRAVRVYVNDVRPDENSLEFELNILSAFYFISIFLFAVWALYKSYKHTQLLRKFEKVKQAAEGMKPVDQNHAANQESSEKQH